MRETFLVLSVPLVEDVKMLEDHQDILTVGVLVDEPERQPGYPADQVLLRGVHHGQGSHHRVEPHRLPTEVTEQSTVVHSEQGCQEGFCSGIFVLVLDDILPFWGFS